VVPSPWQNQLTLAPSSWQTTAHAHDAESANESHGADGRSLLDEIVRDGARQMLAAALRAEVSAYVEQFADQLDEHVV
jgi:hypothetical protein